MHRSARRLIQGIIVLSASLSGRADAQVGYSLSYAPRGPARVHTIMRSDILMTVTHDPGPPEPLSVEATRLEGMTQFFDSEASGRYLVELHYDSLRARLRPIGGTWRDLEAAEGDLGVVRAVVSGKLDVIEAEFVNKPHLQEPKAHMARALGGGHVLTLPEEPQEVGDSWITDLSYPLNAFAEVGRDDGTPDRGELRSQAVAMLDSVVNRSTDTLYYITVRGKFIPAGFTSSVGGDVVSVSGGGSLAAMMVWSSAWSAFVSGATRAVIMMDVRSDSADERVVTHIRLDVTTRSQVRM
ncbi:MAG: hypothetical protein P8X82_15575 [Gemmatimonadales bacterium]|jgi:hypothetical protein